MKLTENFSKIEFDCNDGSEMPLSVLERVKILAEQLQALRDYLDKPIRINSGYRSPDYNHKIGGAKKSQHKLGNAADIVVNGSTPREIREAIFHLIEEGKMLEGGVGSYSSFTHYDIGYNGRKRRWVG